MKITTVVDLPCETGECPVWHPDEARVYWTDIPAGMLYRFDPVTGRHETVLRDRPIGGFTVQQDGALLLFRDQGNVALLRDGKLTPVIETIPGLEQTRFNDVIADPNGRVFAGTLSIDQTRDTGCLYRMDPDGSYRVVSGGYGTPNGMAFTPDSRTLYVTDSRRRRIYGFDFDSETGLITNRRLVVETSEEEARTIGRSDGLTLDEEGYLWSARWDGGHLIRYSPDGRIDRRIPMPTRTISSLTFGGPDWGDLYVTSAKGKQRTPEDPLAGALFHLRPGVRGRPEFRSRIQPAGPHTF